MNPGIFHLRFFLAFLTDFTDCTVISSTIDLFAAIKSRAAAARGKSAVTLKIISFLLMKKSIASHIWKPIARRPAMTLTRACRKNVLKLAVAAICDVINIISNVRYESFSLYLMVTSAPSGPMMVANIQKNIENMSAVDIPRYRV